MRARMTPEQLKEISLEEPFSFTKGCKTLKIPSKESWSILAPCYRYGDRLFDLQQDPEQKHPIDMPVKEVELINAMARLMKENDSPEEQFVRMGISKEADMTVAQLLEQRKLRGTKLLSDELEKLDWEQEAYWKYVGLTNMLEPDNVNVDKTFLTFIKKENVLKVTIPYIDQFASTIFKDEDLAAALYTLLYIARIE